MTTDSPVSILFNTDGVEVNVKPGVAIPANTSAILSAGSDGTNSRFILVDSSGRQIVAGAGTAGTPAGGVITIQGDPSGTPIPVSGTITASNPSIGINGAAIPASSTQMGGSDGTNLQALRAFDADTGGGTQYVLGVNLRLSGSGGSVEFGTNSNPIRIDPTGSTTQPVSGTVTANAGSGTFTVSGTVAATQSGTWTVQPGNTANTTPWLSTISQGGNSATVTGSNALKVDGSAVTQPVSGTVTANVGTTGGLALDATLAKLTIAQSTALGSNTQAMVGGSVTTAAPTYTTGNINPLSLTTAGALRIDGSGVTQPVSGTVTANIGTSGSLALDATLTGGTQTTRITDGTNTATVKAASTAAVAADKALVVAISPNNSITTSNASVGSNGAAIPTSSTQIGGSDGTNLQVPRVFDADTGAGTQYVIGVGLRKSASGGSVELGTSSDPIRTDPTGSTTQPISGTVTANQGGTWTVQPGNTANTTPWLTTISQGGNSATVTGSNALKVDGSAVTQPVSGTVTANIGTSGSLALDATVAKLTIAQSTALGSNTQALMGASVTTAAPTYTTGNINPLSLTTAGALRTDSSGTTQPISGTVAATQSGTWTVQPGNTANTTPWLTTISQGGNSATVTGSNALKVDGSAVTQPVSGTITANIGTSGSLALDATLAKLTIAQSTALGSNTQAMVGGSVTTAAPTYTTGNINPLSLTTAGALRIDGSGVTQPVSGTVTANAGTGNFTVVQSTASNLNATVVGTTAAGSGAASGLVTVQGNASGTPIPVSGTVTATNASVSATGAAPPASATYAGGSVTTAAPSYTTGQMNALSLTTGGLLRVDGSGVTQPISGTVTANIGTSGSLALDATLAKLTIAQSTALGSNTQAMVGGSVTTAAPTYTTGNINPLSLTTAGALRIDGSGTTQPVSGTVTANAGTGNFTVVQSTASNLRAQTASESATGSATPATAGLAGGAVTTAAPSYTNGNLGSLSLTTTGLLRVDGSGVTQPVSGTVTANAGTGNFTVIGTATDNTANSTAKLPVMAALANTSAPTWTNGNMAPLSVDTSGALRITGSISATNPSVSTTGSAPPASATYLGGSVTTAAPSYTNGQMSALSLDTSGALRITGSISASNPSVSTTGAAVPASATYIGGTDASGNLRAPQVDTILGQTVRQLSTASTITSPAASVAGIYAYVNAFGSLRVANEATTVFYDVFDTANIDPNKWRTVVSSGSVTQSSGNLVVAAATGANTYGYATTISNFTSLGTSFGLFGLVANFTGTASGTYRFIGLATTPAAPTTGAPLTNAIGFEYDTAGALYAVVYSAGTNIYRSSALTAPSTTNHRYAMHIRPDSVLFYYDNTEIPAAVTNFTLPTQYNLPITLLSVVGGAGVGSAPTINAFAIGYDDTGKNAHQLADPIYPSRKARINKKGMLNIQSAEIPLFFDHFDSVTNGSSPDANQWNTPTFSGGFAPINGAIQLHTGCLNIFASTTSGTGYISTIPSFNLSGASGKVSCSFNMTVSATANAYWLFGFGDPSTASGQNLWTDGIGFEFSGTTTLNAFVNYSTVIKRVSLTRPTPVSTNAQSTYNIDIYSDRVEFFIDDLLNPVAVIPFVYNSNSTAFGAEPAVSNRPFAIYGNTSSAVSPTVYMTNLFIGESSQQNTMSDPDYPWRRAKVESNGAQLVTVVGSKDRPTYVASNVGGLSTGTAASTTLTVAHLWHPNTVTQRYEIRRIIVSCAGGSGGQSYTVRGDFITAQNGTPGGSTRTPQPLDRSDAASGGTFRVTANTPTRVGNDPFSINVGAGNNIILDFVNTYNGGQPIVLRASQNEGFEIRIVTGGSTLTTAASVTVQFEWAEI